MWLTFNDILRNYFDDYVEKIFWKKYKKLNTDTKSLHLLLCENWITLSKSWNANAIDAGLDIDKGVDKPYWLSTLIKILLIHQLMPSFNDVLGTKSAFIIKEVTFGLAGCIWDPNMVIILAPAGILAHIADFRLDLFNKFPVCQKFTGWLNNISHRMYVLFWVFVKPLWNRRMDIH